MNAIEINLSKREKSSREDTQFDNVVRERSINCISLWFSYFLQRLWLKKYIPLKARLESKSNIKIVPQNTWGSISSKAQITSWLT